MRATTLFLLVVGAAACSPELGPPAWAINAPRLLAVRGEPAEASPGEQVTWSALVVGPDGTKDATALSWSLCRAPRPLGQNASVADSCLTGATVAPLGDGPTATALLPSDACQLFGSELEPQSPDRPPSRPRDPDFTGGYYQPILVELEGAQSVGLQRLRCNLVGASLEDAQAFRARYVANRHPRIARLRVLQGGVERTDLVVAAGSTSQLDVEWTSEDSELYPVFDVVAQRLVDRREQLRVSWFASGGSLAEARTGQDGLDPLSTHNDYVAPVISGPVQLWIVLRDERGGVDWRELELDVTP